MKFFYGFEYWDGRSTTTGSPNTKTGSFSIAGDICVFKSKKDRDEWIKNTSYKYGSPQRTAVSKNELRKLSAGMSLSDFNEWIEHEKQMLDMDLEAL